MDCKIEYIILRDIPKKKKNDEEKIECIKKNDKILFDHTLKWNHPGFLSYFPCSNTDASIIGNFVQSLSENSNSEYTQSKAESDLVERMMESTQELFDIPNKFSPKNVIEN